mgnify:FL=1
MGRLCDLVEIKKDSFFSGAVQAEWFYDNNKRKAVAESYIFHGPKYYGISSDEINSNSHKLCDTVTFTRTIINKIYNDITSSRYALTIAAYGSGKSHLSVALATLLSGDDEETKLNVLENIKSVDKEGYEYIREYSNDKHLVLVLNGIEDFNINKELLKVAKKSLALHGIDDEIFNDMTLAYKTAENYLNSSYKYLYELYLEEAKKISKFKHYNKETLKDVLINNIQDYEAYSIVNNVYKSQTKNDININEGISAKAILNKIHEKYVKEEKRFKSIIIIFDEFGRYLEFASVQPNIAGDAGMQQMFEAIQNSEGSMLFIGYIQSDLNTYRATVNNDNIERYVGRFQSADKYYLSSNLETVLASIVKKKNNAETIISNIFDNTLSYFASSSQKNILRWITELNRKNVWNNEAMYKQVILKGCYPIHPLTLSTLVNLSVYMQQRSTLTFLSDIFEEHVNEEINERIPFIYPTALMSSPIFTELINAEERGRVSGQNCIQYKEIIEANEEVLSKEDKEVLSAILIMNINKYKVYDKNDALVAIETITGKSLKVISNIVSNLEKKLGIIYFDSNVNRYNFMSEGNSKIDYTKVFAKKKLLVNKNDLISNLPDDIRNELQLGIIQPTDFGRRNNIVTSEWSFIREIIDINDFTINMAKALKDSLLKEIHPDGSRGRVIYLYCNNETYSRIDEVISILNQLNYDEIPILIGLLCDNDRVIEDALINLRTLNTFTLLEKELFRKYFRETIMEENKRIIRTYMACAKQKQYVTSKGVRVADEIVQKEMVSKFNMIYNKTIPFSIDSFDKKIAKKARRYFNTIAKCLLDGKLEDIVEFKNLEIDYINRINSILSVDSEKGWKVLYPNNVIGEPLHPVVKEIYTEIKQQILLKQPIKINELLGKYTKAPYGLNIYSITLLIVYVIALNKDNLIIKKGLAKSRISDILMCFNNDDKEQFNEFAKFIIEYTDITEKDNVVLLVEKIEKNIGIAIDQVDSLYNEISQIDELDVTQELKGRFFNCKNNLLIAREKNKEINKKIEDANTYLSKLDKNPFYIRQILTICNPIIDGVIQGSTYRYSVEQVTKSAQVREQAFIIFKNSIKIYGEKCPLDNLNNIDNMYKNTSIQLPKLNAIELVELVKESHEIFKNRIKLKNLASEVCIEINKEISNIKIDIELVRNLTNCKKTINKWLEKRNEYEKLNSNELNNVYKQLEELETKIDIIERNTNQILADAKEIIHSVTTLSDLSNCLGKISNLLDMPMLEDTKNSLKVISDSLKDIDNQLQIFRYKKYTRIEITEVITKISDGNSNLTDLISKIKVNLLENLDLQDKEWKNKFIDKYTDLDSISINELKEIKNKASKDKEFLSDENKILLEDLNRKIESILNKYKIENILNLFNELNSEDRKTCIDKLKTMV